VLTHANGVKAKAEPLTWCITSPALGGKLGGRAALVDKWITMKAEMDQTFKERWRQKNGKYSLRRVRWPSTSENTSTLVSP
jgi:hypothetical protein